MASWGSWSYLYGPLMALVGIGVLAVILRWATRGGTSLVERPARPGDAGEYGLLNVVAAPDTYIEAELLRQQLESAAIKATVAMTNDGPRVMVWPADEDDAKELVSRTGRRRGPAPE
jgi:hypothetical protein